MSNVLYEASPSMVRMNPVGTFLMMLLILIGSLIAVAGDRVAAMLGVPAELDDRILVVIGLVLVAIGLVRLLSWWIATKMDFLKIKDDQLMWTHGLLNKQYVEINLGSVRTVRINQSLLQRMMKAGDITIFTSGDVPELVVKGLPNPDSIRDYIKRETKD